MAVFYVFQNKTYPEESIGGYLWSPKDTKAGGKNSGYYTMTEIRKGDWIIHGYKASIKAVSRAISDCYCAPKPNKPVYVEDGQNWDKGDYKVDAHYYSLEKPLKLAPYRDWIKENNEKESPFNCHGLG